MIKIEHSKSLSLKKKINSVQYFALLRNPTPNFKKNKKSLKNYRPISLPNVPPIADDTVVNEAISNEVVKTARQEQGVNNAPGVSDSGQTPIAGALVDFKTGVIINPSPTDPIDPVTGMRTPSTNMGTISSDGSYQAPKGLELNSNGEFKVDPKAVRAKKEAWRVFPVKK